LAIRRAGGRSTHEGWASTDDIPGEAIAVEVFQQAECSGQLVSMPMVSRVIDQLASHRPTCRCGLCGEVVVKARPDRVFVQAQVWQRSVSATRARATR
jgi:hypothetical protein